jgi:hypothetical protein
MTQHHHHHASHDGNPSSPRLGGSRSEPAKCEVPTISAVSLPRANELSLLNAIAPSHAQAVPLLFAPREIVRSSAGPPGLAVLPASRAIPLRI